MKHGTGTATIFDAIASVSIRTLGKSWLFALVVFVGTVFYAVDGIGQCVPHPAERTAVRFENESSYELTFFVDEDETGVVVPSRTRSPEQPVEAGEHLFRARAIVAGAAVWVWMINEVPKGYVCTWTVTDPPKTVQKKKEWR
jgi:hypothetical protein